MTNSDTKIFLTIGKYSDKNFQEDLIDFIKNKYNPIDLDKLRIELNNILSQDEVSENIKELANLYIQGLPSLYDSKIMKEKFTSKEKIKEYVSANTFYAIKKELNIFKETNEFFKNRNRRSMFWRRKLVSLISKGL